MKKSLLILVSLFITLGISAQESSQSTSQNDTYDTSAPYPWTFGVKGGINYFRLPDKLTGSTSDKTEYNSGTFDDVSQQASLFAEYNFNKFIGLGLYVGNYSFNRKVVYGSSIESGVYMHLNLMECFSWRRPPLIARRLHINTDIGLGGAAWWQTNVLKGDATSDKRYWYGYSVLKAALQLEFFLRPQWSLLLEGEYHFYGKPAKQRDVSTHMFGFSNAGAINVGLRYYFDTRKDKDPYAVEDGLNSNNLPIKKKGQPKQTNVKQSKNTIYVNVNVTPDMLEEARTTGKPVSVKATEAGSESPNVEVVSVSKNSEVYTAMSTLTTGRDAEIQSVRFDSNDELTPASKQTLDEIALFLLNNNNWNHVDFLYICNGNAPKKAADIRNYLEAKGIRHFTVIGRETKDNAETNDLMISIQ